MRDALMESLFELAEKDPNIMLLTGDLGYGVFEEFEKTYPNQYLNVGVAEQNMIGVATGLALEGKTIFTYSIGNFPTLRCLEQIRNDACYHELNINIIATGGGFSYGGLGMSHHATEDIAIMRALPNMTILIPTTAEETSSSVVNLYHNKGAGYLRLDKSKFTDASLAHSKNVLGKVNILREGNDITLIVVGGIADEVMKAASELSNKKIECRVLSLYSIRPIDKDAIKMACKETMGIVTIEEGNLAGGMGSAIAEVCMDNKFKPKIFKRVGLEERYSAVVGSQNYLRSYYKMDSMAIIDFVLKEYEKLLK
jgi:transketolase